jgi:uncharacterized protein (TIGR03437 family)
MSLLKFGQPDDGGVQSAYQARRADSAIRKRASLSRCGKILVAHIAAAAIGWGQPVVSAVLNGASYSGNVAPGTWVSIFGAHLSASTATANSVPLKTTLGGVMVTFNGIAAPLSYVSPNQINAIVPFETAVALTSPPPIVRVPVVVTNIAGASAPVSLTLSRNSPGFFTVNGQGTGAAIALDQNFNLISSVGTGPIVLYAAGLGPTDPPASSASGGASSEPLNRVVDDVSVFIGDVQATVLFAGLAPGFPGIYQLNVVPNGPVTDRVYLQVNGWQSNIASLSIPAGSNAINVTGSVLGAYPPSANRVPYSTLLAAGKFNLDLVVAPNAKPFSVVATSDAGNAIFQIDPSAGTWQATMKVPTLAARNGDFSASGWTIWDFSTCMTNGVCSPFPGNQIPLSDLLVQEAQALFLIPLPNELPLTPPDGFCYLAGNLSATGHFTYNVTYGDFMQITEAGPATRNATFALYVDGKLIDSQVVPYQVLQP